MAFTYELHGHGWMLGHSLRTESYIEALRRIVRPGDTVLDIGTGVGTWALAAVRCGAKRVYAVDPSPVIRVARELAVANGCGDRIEFIEGVTTETTLPERVDVIVQEIQGVLPMFGSSLAVLIDARTRLLKSGGVMVPGRDSLWAALVDSPDVYAAHDRPWGDHDPGFVLDAVRSALTNYWCKRPIVAASLVQGGQMWAALDYHRVDSPHVCGTLAWTMRTVATVHGVAVWFDADLAAGVTFSNAPGAPKLPFGQAFFPFRHPVVLSAGDTVRLELTARLIGREYLWLWVVQADDAAGKTKVRLEQSDFWKLAMPPTLLAKAEAGYVPQRNLDRSIDSLILEGFERCASAEQIASSLRSRFPERFENEAAASDRVAALAGVYDVVHTGSV